MPTTLAAVHVRHFKSLTDVHIENLTPISVLVGTNAAGKSNIVDALKFVRDATIDGLDHAISKRGGIGVIRQYSPSRPYQITFQLDFKQDLDEDTQEIASYELKISTLKGGNFQVESERIVWWEEQFDYDSEDNEWTILGHFKREVARNASGMVTDSGSHGDPDPVQNRPLPPDQLVLGTRVLTHFPIAQPLVSTIGRFRFSSVFPNTLREPSRPETDRILNESGENWASVVKSLRQTSAGKIALKRIMEMMRIVMPTLQDVNVKGIGGYLVPQFRVKDRKQGSSHDFDPVQLSDGTLRVFSTLLALYQTPPPSFLAIEEPEQTIHPGILPMLAEAFHEVSNMTQLFITTHSPYLIDQFDPSNIRVVTIKSGATRVSSIKASQVESVKERLTSLQELMLAEGLLPNE